MVDGTLNTGGVVACLPRNENHIADIRDGYLRIAVTACGIVQSTVATRIGHIAYLAVFNRQRKLCMDSECHQRDQTCG